MILDYCDGATRLNCMLLCKKLHAICTSEDYFRRRLERLHIEQGVHYSHVLPPNNSWKSVFMELSSTHRLLWSDSKKNVSNKNNNSRKRHRTDFNISVSARFKPKEMSNNRSGTVKKVSLPLHQRLALIKIANNLSSNKDALHVLKDQGGWFNKRWSAEVENNETIQNKQANDDDDSTHSTITSGIQNINYQSNSVIIVEPNKGLVEIQFNAVMNDACTQQYMYESSTAGLVSDLINGIDATCLVYGQTGSGKTHTMFGATSGEQPIDCNARQTSDKWGLVPRACFEIFRNIDYRKKCLNFVIESSVFVSYIEIYGDGVSDLLREGAPCGHSKVSAQRFVLDGSAEVPVTSFHDMANLLNRGEKQKRIAATSMNEQSSRAHTIVILTLRQKCEERGVRHTSRLFMADLGGSEQQKKSEVKVHTNLHDNQNQDPLSLSLQQKDRMKEAVNINMGLLALKQCVDSLNKRKVFIPYADSKLTMLLSPGLGGNSKTAVVICAAQEVEHCVETVASLRFGQLCSKIKKSISRHKSDHNVMQELIAQLDKQIEECELRVKKNERWHVTEQKKIDTFGEVEIKKTTTLVGAEQVRIELEDLLRRKAELIGEPAFLV